MKCAYCGNEMILGKVIAVGGGPALNWKDKEIEIRLNDEPGFVAICNGDRISGYRCEKCKKIVIDYK